MANKKKERIRLTRQKHDVARLQGQIVREIGTLEYDAERTRAALADSVSPNAMHPEYHLTPIGMCFLNFAASADASDAFFCDLLMKFKYLLEAGADATTPAVDIRLLFFTDEDELGFHKISMKRKFLIAKALIKYLPPSTLDHCDDGDLSMLYQSASHGKTEYVAMLLALKADPDVAVPITFPESSQERPLHVASERGYEKIIACLIKAGADLNARKVVHQYTRVATALGLAADNGHDEIVEQLLTARADVNAAGPVVDTADDYPGGISASPFWAAARSNHLKTMRLLLRHQADPNQPVADGFTPLQFAAQEHNDLIFSALLADGVALHQANQQGLNALHLACSVGNEFCVAALLERGADVNGMTDGTGSSPCNGRQKVSPLMLACKNDHVGCIQLLVEGHAALESDSVPHCDCHGTPWCIRANALTTLCAKGHEHALEALLDSKLELSGDDLRETRKLAKAMDLERGTECARIIKAKLRQCALCGVAVATKRCSRCERAYYCGKEHQKEHWKLHKLSCKVICTQGGRGVKEQPPTDMSSVD